MITLKRRGFLITATVLVLLLVTILAWTAHAEELSIVKRGTCGALGTNVTWTLDSEGTLYISGTGDMQDYDYKQFVPWYSYKDAITQVIVGDGVTSVSPYTCYQSASLNKVVLGKDVEKIEHEAFYNCAVLKEVQFGAGLKTIGYSAFQRCTALSQAVLPDGLTTIENTAFKGCSALKQVNVPQSVTYIDSAVFDECGQLSYYTAGGGKYLGNDENPYHAMIKGANNTVTEFTFQPETCVIAGGAFQNFASLKSITIPESVTHIAAMTFYGCSVLKTVTLHDEIETIGRTAFYNCKKLSAITIPAALRQIGGSAFYGCSALKKVTITDVFGWCQIHFEDANAHPVRNGASLYLNDQVLTELVVPAGIEKINDYAFSQCSGLKTVILPEGLTEIGYYAFYGSGITTIHIPSTLTRIKSDAFGLCSRTINAHIADIASWCAVDFAELESNPMWYKGKVYQDGMPVQTVVIPQGVETVKPYAFYGVSGITVVAFPSSIKDIQDSSFSNCSNLRHIFYQGSQSQWEAVNKAASRLPECTTHFGFVGDPTMLFSEHSFCSGTGVYCALCQDYWSFTPAKTPGHSFTDGVCTHCGAPEEWTYTVNADATITITGHATASGELTIPAEIEGLPVTVLRPAFNNMYRDNTTLTALTIPSSVRQLENYALRSCKALEKVTFEGGNMRVGYAAFASCTGLKEVHISDLGAWCSSSFQGTNANPLANGAQLYNNGQLVSGVVEIPAGTKTVGRGIFDGYTPITGIIVPDSVESMQEGAFSGCTQLEELVIPFVTDPKKTANDINQYPFGYLFSSSAGDGLIAAVQRYHKDNINSYTTTTYYLPQTLQKVTVTGGEILPGAFSGCNGLKQIVWQGEGSQIGAYAFENCTGLTNVTISGEIIEAYAFSGCSALTDVTLGDSMEKIEYCAFDGCKSITNVYCPSLETWCAIEFYDSAANPVASAGNLYIANEKLAGELIIPESVPYIGAYAFYNVNGITSLKVADNMEGIGTKAFYSCDDLVAVEIGDRVKQIGASAFAECKQLTKIRIGKNMDTIGNEAFSHCGEITELALGDGLKTIGDRAFYRYTTAVTQKVVIPNGVETIGAHAFAEDIVELVLPESLQTVSMSAFDKVSLVRYGGSFAQWEKVDLEDSRNALSWAYVYCNADGTIPGEPGGELWDGCIANSFDSGSGTQEDPYVIRTAAQLAWLSYSVNAGTDYANTYFLLAEDIRLNDETFTFQPDTGLIQVTDGVHTAYLGTGLCGQAGGNTTFDTTASTPFVWYASDTSVEEGVYGGELNHWTPPNGFAGIFDGNGKAVYGMYSRKNGVFAKVENGGVYNLHAENFFVSGAPIVGTARSSAVVNCSSNGCVVGNGGVVGEFYKPTVFSDCKNMSVVIGTERVGGIVGYHSTDGRDTWQISNCVNEGAVYATVGYAGGIVGYNNTQTDMVNCQNNGSVTGVTGAGGLVGLVNLGGDIRACTNTGTVSSQGYSGGLIGSMGCHLENYVITQCVNTGDVYGTESVGGIVGIYYGFGRSTSMSACSNEGKIVGDSYVGGLVGYAETFVTANADDISNYSYSTTKLFVMKCRNTGAVSAKTYAGGIVGGSYAENQSHYKVGTEITDCYNLGRITVSVNYAGGILAYTEGISSYAETKIQNCYNAGYITEGCHGVLSHVVTASGASLAVSDCYSWNIYAGPEVEGVTPVPGANMTDRASYAGFDFDEVWGIHSSYNDGYPYLIAIAGQISIPGDMNEDGEVSDADAIYLLWHALFPEGYPVQQDADVNSDGEVNDADAIYLLWHALFPEGYPLYPKES